MKYMLLIYQEENIMTESERQKCMEDSTQLCHRLNEKKQFVSAAPLYPVSTATSMKVRPDKVVVTDGPFAETREQLGGYYVIDVANLDEGMQVAKQIPGAKWGTVEIRPIIELPNVPAGGH